MDPSVNKDLILREKLALERTKMANDRTLLSFLRTSLYFAIAGLSLEELLRLPNGFWLKVLFWALSALLLAAGILSYLRQRKKIEESRRHIGNYLLE